MCDLEKSFPTPQKGFFLLSALLSKGGGKQRVEASHHNTSELYDIITEEIWQEMALDCKVFTLLD